MRNTVERVGPDELSELHEPLRLASKDIQRRFDLSHWVPVYPLHLFEKSAMERCVHAVRDGAERDGTGRAVATFSLGSEGSNHYDDSLWAEPGSKAAYLSRLAVHPSMQGQGLGAWCMAEAERLAHDAGAAVVRLDTHPTFDALHRFYERCGYERRGLVTWRDDDSLLCWDKGLAS